MCDGVTKYMDSDGRIWVRPTAEAYARVCKAANFHAESVERLKKELLAEKERNK